jgi:2-keto-4-pentenoate hydratase/2-oxohepta-3-ene-1,7-dioic acid hydratase in catechol pathway
MRLVTYTFRGSKRIGAMLGERAVVDLPRAAARFGVARLPETMIELLEGGDAAMESARRALDAAAERAERSRAELAEAGIVFDAHEPGFRLEAPVPRPRKALGIGLNYRDHAAEAGAQLPKQPVVFTKVSSCIIGPGAPIHRPMVSGSVDWEGEFCFIVGRKARHVAAADALKYVAGYAIGNDVSVRDWQFHSGTWIMGKGFDTHGPLGPWLVTPEEAGDITNLDLKTWVNGELKQSSNTSQLIFGVGQLIEYISKAFTLEPGDAVFTGTPAGVGVARKPPEFLKPGDVVRIEITRLGVLENPVIAEPES